MDPSKRTAEYSTGTAKDYRQWKQSPESARNYESAYTKNNHPSMMLSLEQVILLPELERLRAAVPQIRYLDFACGTGRVISFLEPQVAHATGIDISEHMLEFAAQKVKTADLLCKDISIETGPPEAQYDLITAFRFFLNAETPLRLAIAKALRRRMRDRNSRLIINSHNNLLSYKLLAWPIYRLRRALTGKPMPNYFTLRDAKKLCAEAGLEVVAAHGYAFFSARILHLLSLDQLFKLERALIDAPFAWRFATHQMFIIRLKR